jgi:hypothetical protein
MELEYYFFYRVIKLVSRSIHAKRALRKPDNKRAFAMAVPRIVTKVMIWLKCTPSEISPAIVEIQNLRRNANFLRFKNIKLVQI